MKTPIKLLNTDIIAVEVPKESTNLSIGSEGFCLYFTHELKLKHIDLSFGKLELLGEATEDEISFDVEPYVDKNHFISMFDGQETFNYKNYLFTHYSCLDSKESFRSLLQSSGLNWVNEYQNDWDELCTSGHGDFSKDGKTSSALYFEDESKRIKGKLIFLKPIK